MKLTLDDFVCRLRRLKQLGGIKEILRGVPGLGDRFDELGFEANAFSRAEGMISSMTRKERARPNLLHEGRRRDRIARGSGTTLAEVDDLLLQFMAMQEAQRRLDEMR